MKRNQHSLANRATRLLHSAEGFTLMETLIAMLIMTFGLLAAGQLMFVAVGSASLARSKGNAAVVAQNKLEFLADLFRQNSADAALTNGNHGPEQVQILNPSASGALNRYNVSWTVATVSDPRAGKVLSARSVTVTVNPIGSGTSANNQKSLNKVVNVTDIFSPRIQ